MTLIHNYAGTIKPRFRIGKNGITIYQGTVSPLVTPISGSIDGDLFVLQSGGSSTLYQQVGGSWIAIGTVTSVGLTAGSSKINITGTSPITSSGSFSVDVNESNLTLNNIGGTLGTSKGGTGLTGFTSNNIFYASSTSAIGQIAPTGTNTYLQWTGSAYQWASSTGGIAGITLQNTGSTVGTSAGITTLNVTNTAGTALAATGSTSTGTINFNPANVNLSAFGGTLNLASQVSGVLPIANGGLGSNLTIAKGDLIWGSAISTLSNLAIGSLGQVLTVGASSTLTWATSTTGTVTSVGLSAASSKVVITGTSPITSSGSFTVDVVESNLTLNNIGGTLGTTKGGTNITSYTTGDILYASATNTLSKLPLGSNKQILQINAGTIGWANPDGGTVTSVTVAAGSSKLSSSGSPISTSGTITLDVVEANLTHNNIGGTLGTTKGGTGLTSFTTNNLFYASSSSTVGQIPPTGTYTVLQWTGSAYQWATAGNVVTVAGVSTTYNVLSTDFYVGATAVPITINLPVGIDGKQVVVKDETGTAGNANTVFIVPQSGATIDGAANYAIKTKYGAVTLIYRGTNWNIT